MKNLKIRNFWAAKLRSKKCESFDGPWHQNAANGENDLELAAKNSPLAAFWCEGSSERTSINYRPVSTSHRPLSEMIFKGRYLRTPNLSEIIEILLVLVRYEMWKFFSVMVQSEVSIFSWSWIDPVRNLKIFLVMVRSGPRTSMVLAEPNRSVQNQAVSVRGSLIKGDLLRFMSHRLWTTSKTNWKISLH